MLISLFPSSHLFPHCNVFFFVLHFSEFSDAYCDYCYSCCCLFHNSVFFSSLSLKHIFNTCTLHTTYTSIVRFAISIWFLFFVVFVALMLNVSYLLVDHFCCNFFFTSFHLRSCCRSFFSFLFFSLFSVPLFSHLSVHIRMFNVHGDAFIGYSEKNAIKMRDFVEIRI